MLAFGVPQGYDRIKEAEKVEAEALGKTVEELAKEIENTPDLVDTVTDTKPQVDNRELLDPNLFDIYVEDVKNNRGGDDGEPQMGLDCNYNPFAPFPDKEDDGFGKW